ncbi:MAG TPA: tetratricopeptide repeat protein [Thermoanaerobaculia bacterium]|nr:tetratricopeptide repeat protein [Thermoanaerobaculia bacterium]
MSLERIEITPFAVIAGEILQQRRTGSLTIVRAPLRRNLYFAQGELALITSTSPEDSLADFLVRRGVITADRALPLAAADPLEAAAKFHESGLLDMSARQTLLREWMTSLFIPLFSLDEGTAAFTDVEAIEPDKRVFLQSMPAVVLDGIRAITNGLVLRRSLGDLKRTIEPDHTAAVSLDAIPLTDAERAIAEALNEPQTVETFLKQFTSDSVTAARVVIAMLTLGLFSVVTHAARPIAAIDDSDMHRDLELLAAIGSNDQRSLRAVALSRQLPSLDHYQLLEIPRAATRGQIVGAADQKKHQYNPSTYPPVLKDALATLNKRINEAAAVLGNPVRRSAYDKLLHQRTGRGGGDELQRRAAQRSIANQNFQRARELSATGDYYGAIVLLKQTVNYAPDHAEAWHLLGACQERNPKWRRDAAESFQRALSLDPNSVDVLISLGDLYRTEGLISRAQSCYEDVLKIAADHPEAKSRLAGIRKK